MALALKQADKASQQKEVPVGAVITYQDKVIARAHNRVEKKQSVTYHAEIIALKQAARKLGSWRLDKCELYVTLEPCAMCAGAIIWSRISRVIYAVADPKAGACGSVLTVIGNKQLNHLPKLKANVMSAESSRLLKAFFRELRKK